MSPVYRFSSVRPTTAHRQFITLCVQLCVQHDGLDTARVILCTVEVSATPVDSVWPMYGPVAGGTRVTIIGQILAVAIVKAVYFGQHEGIIDRQRSAVELFLLRITSILFYCYCPIFLRHNM